MSTLVSVLIGLGRLPALVFFNACQSARIEGRSRKKGPSKTGTELVETNVSLAEAFLRGGVANYVGTHWSVGFVRLKV